MNSYILSRQWFDFVFENADKIKPHHGAIYFWLVELANRLGWPPHFANPGTQAMAASGISSFNTYKKGFDDLVEFGFVRIIQKSSNQYTANIIALSIIDAALDGALDKALANHPPCHIKNSSGTGSGTMHGTGDITKPETLNNHLSNNNCETADFIETPGGTNPPDLFGHAKSKSKKAAHTGGAAAAKPVSGKTTFNTAFPSIEVWMESFKGTELETAGANLVYYFTKYKNYGERSRKIYANWKKVLTGWMMEEKAAGKLVLNSSAPVPGKSQAEKAITTAADALEILNKTRNDG